MMSTASCYITQVDIWENLPSLLPNLRETFHPDYRPTVLFSTKHFGEQQSSRSIFPFLCNTPASFTSTNKYILCINLIRKKMGWDDTATDMLSLTDQLIPTLLHLLSFLLSVIFILFLPELIFNSKIKDCCYLDSIAQFLVKIHH